MKTFYNGSRRPTAIKSEPYRRETPDYPSDPVDRGIGATNCTQQYTGTVVVGIGLLHKSNYVPVTAGENMDPKKHQGGTE